MRYLIVIQKYGNYSACFPDIDGIAIAGQTVEEVMERAREALAMHLEGNEPPQARTLAWHLAHGLDVDFPPAITLYGSVEYEPAQALAAIQ